MHRCVTLVRICKYAGHTWIPSLTGSNVELTLHGLAWRAAGGRAAVHWAAHHGMAQTLCKLLEAGSGAAADIDAEDSEGWARHWQGLLLRQQLACLDILVFSAALSALANPTACLQSGALLACPAQGDATAAGRPAGPPRGGRAAAGARRQGGCTQQERSDAPHGRQPVCSRGHCASPAEQVRMRGWQKLRALLRTAARRVGATTPCLADASNLDT